MAFTRSLVRNTIVRGLWLAAGRRNLVRFARLLTMESRLDVANDMDSNGERMVQECVLAGAGARPVIFDVGANVGAWTESALNIVKRLGVPGAHVYCFEPASLTYQRLVAHLHGAHASVTPVRAALSNVDGAASLNIFGDGLGINSLHPAGDDRGTVATEQVELMTADSFCARERIEQIDLLKIDAEGHDLSVLEGATSLLEAQRIGVLQFEYNQRWIDSRHYLRDAFELLLPRGYQIGKVTPRGIEFYPRWHFELETFREGNYLACRSDLVERFPQIPWWNLE